MIGPGLPNQCPSSTGYRVSPLRRETISTGCRDPQHRPSSTGSHPLPRAVSRETGGACGQRVWITFRAVGRCPRTACGGVGDGSQTASGRCRSTRLRWSFGFRSQREKVACRGAEAVLDRTAASGAWSFHRAQPLRGFPQGHCLPTPGRATPTTPLKVQSAVRREQGVGRPPVEVPAERTVAPQGPQR